MGWVRLCVRESRRGQTHEWGEIQIPQTGKGIYSGIREWQDLGIVSFEREGPYLENTIGAPALQLRAPKLATPNSTSDPSAVVVSSGPPESPPHMPTSGRPAAHRAEAGSLEGTLPPHTEHCARSSVLGHIVCCLVRELGERVGEGLVQTTAPGGRQYVVYETPPVCLSLIHI